MKRFRFCRFGDIAFISFLFSIRYELHPFHRAPFHFFSLLFQDA